VSAITELFSFLFYFMQEIRKGNTGDLQINAKKMQGSKIYSRRGNKKSSHFIFCCSASSIGGRSVANLQN